MNTYKDYAKAKEFSGGKQIKIENFEVLSQEEFEKRKGKKLDWETKDGFVRVLTFFDFVKNNTRILEQTSSRLQDAFAKYEAEIGDTGILGMSQKEGSKAYDWTWTKMQ